MPRKSCIPFFLNRCHVVLVLRKEVVMSFSKGTIGHIVRSKLADFADDLDLLAKGSSKLTEQQDDSLSHGVSSLAK